MQVQARYDHTYVRTAASHSHIKLSEECCWHLHPMTRRDCASAWKDIIEVQQLKLWLRPMLARLMLRKSISPHVIFAELAEAPWQRTWWSQVLRFMHRLDSMDGGSLHPDILSDNIHDALCNPGCCNWAAGVQKQFASLGVPSPFSGGRVCNVDHLAFREAMRARDMSVWGGLHISPRGAPSIDAHDHYLSTTAT